MLRDPDFRFQEGRVADSLKETDDSFLQRTPTENGT